MKFRTIFLTSAVTTLVLVGILFATLAVASPGMAQVQPVSRAPSLSASHLALPGGGGGLVWNLLGSDMVDTVWTAKHVNAFGCLYYEVGSTTTSAIATVHLPDGATIQWMRFYWRDWVDPYNVELQLRAYHIEAPQADYDLLATLYSTGTAASPAESYTDSAALSILVDNASFLYMLYANTHYAEDDQKLCSVQIGYTVPGIFGAAMPFASSSVK